MRILALACSAVSKLPSLEHPPTGRGRTNAAVAGLSRDRAVLAPDPLVHGSDNAENENGALAATARSEACRLGDR
jgi:hypothetical protein